jgi:hypothetical protein
MALQRRLLCELTSRECNEYQVQGGDIMLVPVGSIEALGPHLPVGARCFVAEAFSRLMAEAVGGLYLPVTPYSSAGAAFDRQGTVDIPERTLNSYLRAVMDDLLATGFRRVLVVTYLDYLRYYIPQELYEDHGVAAAGIHLGEELGGRGAGSGVREGSWVLGALRVLGRHDLVAKAETENRRLLAKGFQQPALPPELAALQGVGVVGHACPAGAHPIPPDPDLSAEGGERVLRQTVVELAPAVAALRDYNEFLARRGNSRGLLWRGWRWTE